MGKRLLWLLVVVLAVNACGTLAKRQRIDKFEDLERGYRQALMASDFSTAARYVDPSAPVGDAPAQQSPLLKIVDYKPTYVEISEDLLRIEQQVVLKYFMLDTNLLRTVEYRQVWRFDETDKIWLLQTDLPAFKP